LAWARRHSAWTDEDWEKVLFSDETMIELGPTRSTPRCYRKPGQRLAPGFVRNTTKHPRKFMLWGCFGGEKIGPMLPIQGNLDSHGYVRILRQALPQARLDVFDGGPFMFQQDNAPCHVSGVTKRWLERHEIELLTWPAQSPDLNPIENLWGIIKRKVDQHRPLSSMEELMRVVDTTLDGIEEKTLTSLVNSMPSRIRAVIANKGCPIDY